MKKIYLTGIPASGKTTLVDRIMSLQDDIMTISYSTILANYIAKKMDIHIEKCDLRERSSSIIDSEDIKNVDKEIINLVNSYINQKHIIIDSHATTIENYGIRTTPFTKKVLEELNFDILISLFAEPETIYRRIENNACGRKKMSKHMIEFSMNVQSTLVLSYGDILEKPVYFLDSSKNIDFLANWVLDKINA